MLWMCGIVGQWGCEGVGLLGCGGVGVWGCGAVTLWMCGIVWQWSCGGVGVWGCGIGLDCIGVFGRAIPGSQATQPTTPVALTSEQPPHACRPEAGVPQPLKHAPQ